MAMLESDHILSDSPGLEFFAECRSFPEFPQTASVFCRMLNRCLIFLTA